MHIAYVSIWCPVDIVVLNLDFTDLCRFYITCGVGEMRGEGGGLRVVCLLQMGVQICSLGDPFIYFLALFKVQ